MSISNDYTIVIPHDWSGEEALDVLCFLEQIAQCIWNLHGDGMTAAMRRRNAASGTVKYQPPSADADLCSWTPSTSTEDE